MYQQGDTRRETITVQTGSTTFHVIMCCLTGGLWAIPWVLLFRRKTHVKTRVSYR